MSNNSGDDSLASSHSCSSCNPPNEDSIQIKSANKEPILGGLSVQDEFAPNSICFGCGPSNKEGLQLKSYRYSGGLVAEFESEEKHQAFQGVINGGIIGSLIDCHGNWTAAVAIMDRNGWEKPQCTVTAQYEVKLKRPTPFGKKLTKGYSRRFRFHPPQGALLPKWPRVKCEMAQCSKKGNRCRACKKSSVAMVRL